MENVSIPESGGKYLWVKNTDASNGKVVLRKSILLGVVIPMVIDVGVEEHIKSLPNSSDMFLTPESVEEWGYDIREYSAYSMDDVDDDADKYVWWFTGFSDRYALAKQGDYDISIVTLDNSIDASTLVGNPLYMLSEAEVDNSVFDADKFLAVGYNGVLSRGEAQEDSEELAPASTPTLARKPKYKMSDKFDKLHSEDVVVITIANKEEADILASLLPIDCEYHVGDSDEDTSNSLLVYPEQTGYGADFTTLERHFGNPIITFAEAVVELYSTTFSTDGDASDVISAPYVTATTTNGIAIDLSHTPIGTGELPSAGITSAKINLVWYKTTDKFKEALCKGTVFIPVENDKEAAILSSIMEIDLSHMYRPEYRGGTLIASEGVPARFSPFINYPNGTRLAFGDAVEPL